jgi:hypothetical protein
MFLANHTPPLSWMLDDLTTRDPAKIAKHLDISTKTLARWKMTDTAPRTAMLAIFYETQWGKNLVHTTAHNGEMYARAQVQGLERENAMLRARIARLESIGDFGAANAPRLATY